VSGESRVKNAFLRSKITSAEPAAQLVRHGDNVGMSGFTGSGYPKAVPQALAKRMIEAHERDEALKIGMWTGASTAPELDGTLAQAAGVGLRLPYQSDPITRRLINSGEIDYTDIHLSHVAQYAWFGFLGRLDVAVIEVTAVLPDGRLVPSSSVGNNKTWLDQADKVILEVNSWQNPDLEGMHDIYYGTALPPHRKPLPITYAGQRIGTPYFTVDPDKVIAVVETDAPDRNSPFTPPDAGSRKIAGHILDFLANEVRHNRLPKDLLPLQSGVGNVANAVLSDLNAGPYQNLTAYTEVLQDGMLDMLRSGQLLSASCTAFSLSPEALEELNRDLPLFHDKIVLRSQEISNHPEAIRRLGVIAMNGIIEADIYGNVNSTHIMGSQIMNGIGGSGDFARNAFLSIFMSPSLAKNGAISAIVPMVSHVDHTEHDVQVLVTEQGLADLRGLSPKRRAAAIIQNCAHPDYRDQLMDYFKRASDSASGKHTPHILSEALSWHERFVQTGHM